MDPTLAVLTLLPLVIGTYLPTCLPTCLGRCDFKKLIKNLKMHQTPTPLLRCSARGSNKDRSNNFGSKVGTKREKFLVKFQ